MAVTIVDHDWTEDTWVADVVIWCKVENRETVFCATEGDVTLFDGREFGEYNKVFQALYAGGYLGLKSTTKRSEEAQGSDRAATQPTTLH